MICIINDAPFRTSLAGGWVLCVTILYMVSYIGAIIILRAFDNDYSYKEHKEYWVTFVVYMGVVRYNIVYSIIHSRGDSIERLKIQ